MTIYRQIILTTYEMQNEAHHMYFIDQLEHGKNAITQFHNICMDGPLPFIHFQDSFLDVFMNAPVRYSHRGPDILQFAPASTLPDRFDQIRLNEVNQAGPYFDIDPPSSSVLDD